jgi:hypothetical protein
VNVDCAWHFDTGLAFGRVVLVGRKKRGNTIVPIQIPVKLDSAENSDVVVACHFYDEVPAAEVAALRQKHGLKDKHKRLFRLGSADWSTVSCERSWDIAVFAVLVCNCVS